MDFVKAVVGSGACGLCGSVCKCFKAKMVTWLEMADLLEQLHLKQSVIRAVTALNRVMQPHSRRIRFELLDMRFMHVWPKQSKLAKMYHGIQADMLKKVGSSQLAGSIVVCLTH